MMFSRCLSLTLAGLAWVGGAACGADDAFNDLRLHVGLLPGIKKVDLTASGASLTSDISSKTGSDIAVQFQHGEVVNGPWGWVAGASVFIDTSKGDTQGTTIKSTAFGVAVDGGALYRITKEIQLELTPFIGIGADKLKSSGSTSGSGLFLKYGITLAGLYQFNEHWQAGADVGFEAFRAKGKADYIGIGTDQSATAKGQGVIAGLILGYRF